MLFSYEGLLVTFFFVCIFIFVKVVSIFIRDLTLRLQYKFLIDCEPVEYNYVSDKTPFIF
jgi:hypothetical protein